ncbi:hypothetical protein [Phytohabitans kaempferiae]|uniref:Uncharacterized protein n=1 Tax=Phytohabitans kaempferiae TaxID=1620943 RepID=A0ABV6LWN1_9ACTN
MSHRPLLRPARSAVHALIFLTLLLDPIIVGWLLFTPRPLGETMVAAAVSLAILPLLAAIKVALDIAISGRAPYDEFDNLHYSRLLRNHRAAQNAPRHGRRWWW